MQWGRPCLLRDQKDLGCAGTGVRGERASSTAVQGEKIGA